MATTGVTESPVSANGGYTDLSQIGEAADYANQAPGTLWDAVASQIQTGRTVESDLSPGVFRDGLNPEDYKDFQEKSWNATSFGYLAVQQILAGYVPKNFATTIKAITSIGQPLDDRKLVMEDLVQLLATSAREPGKRPERLVNDLQGQFINLLWHDLPHPPVDTLQRDMRFRLPDDSYNNPYLPKLGAAGQSYARSVPPLHAAPPDLPSYDELFDSLLRRPGGTFHPHPSGISSLLFGFANTIIHSCFQTSHADPTINEASSYLSLSPLYGNNEADQEKVRDTKHLGEGLVWPDTFSSARLLLMPNPASAIMVLFSRNHNRIAGEILKRNERGRWSLDPSKLPDDAARQRQDDEIFGTARNINCQTYVNVILTDYVQAILGTVQADSTWSLDPRIEIKNLIGRTPTGSGNAVSVEFNTLYRWHAPSSRKDTLWLEDKMALGRRDRNWDAMTWSDFQKAAQIHGAELGMKASRDSQGNLDYLNPQAWKLSKFETGPMANTGRVTYDSGVYERDDTGRFRDEDIARMLKDATKDVASAYGARNIPAVFRAIDRQTMQTGGETWKLCTLNEFRRFLGLKAFATFGEWNDDDAKDQQTGMTVAQAAEALYGNPDNIELYVGLMAEKSKAPRVGAGLCAGYTLTRAILSDAVALVRADRYYNASASADELTDWGLQDSAPSVTDGSYGGILSRVIRNNLPDQYAFNDVALLFPFQTPDRMEHVLYNIKRWKIRDYSFNAPSPERVRPSAVSGLPVIRMQALLHKAPLRSNIATVFEALRSAIGEIGDEYKIFGNSLHHVIAASSSNRNPHSQYADVKSVDILRDAVVPLTLGHLASIFGVLQTSWHSQLELFSQLSNLYLYLHAAPQPTWEQRTAAREASAKLHTQLLTRITAHSTPSSIGGSIWKTAANAALGAFDAVDGVAKTLTGRHLTHPVSPVCHAFYENLERVNSQFEDPPSSEELAADCLQALSLLAYVFVNGAATSIDKFLDDEARFGKAVKHARTVRTADGQAVDASAGILATHGLEHIRINHWHDSIKRFVSKKQAARLAKRDLSVVPSRSHEAWDPSFNENRAHEECVHLVDNNEDALKIFTKYLQTTLPIVLGLPNVRRAEGQQGRLNRLDVVGSLEGIPSMTLLYN